MGCSESEKRSQLVHYYARKQLFLDHLGGKCVTCGSVSELQFDHIDPDTKSFTIGGRIRCDLEEVLEELKKCQLLCKKCHLEKSKLEGSLGKGWANEPRLVHGSRWTYAHHKCRCDPCVWSNDERNRERRRDQRVGGGRKLRNTGQTVHGQRRMYLKGCKCALCKKANSEYSKELKSRK
jgi:hypothetical protein